MAALVLPAHEDSTTGSSCDHFAVDLPGIDSFDSMLDERSARHRLAKVLPLAGKLNLLRREPLRNRPGLIVARESIQSGSDGVVSAVVPHITTWRG